MPTVDLNANALTTLETALDELGLVSDDGGAQDIRLARYINAASNRIESFLGKKLWRDTTIVEKVEGYRTSFVHLDRTPINDVASVSFDGSAIASDMYEIHDAEAGQLYAVGGWPWTTAVDQAITSTPMPGYERKLIQVTYDGGYVTSAQAAYDDDFADEEVTLPTEIEQACLMLTAMLWRGRGRDASITSERLMSWSATYDKGGGETGAGLPPAIAAMIEDHRRPRIA